MQVTLRYQSAARLFLAAWVGLFSTSACSATATDPAPTTTTLTATTAPTAPPTTSISTTTTRPEPTTTTTTTSTTTTTLAASTTAPSSIPDRSIVVPQAEPASIDGVISPGEWDQAAPVTLSNGDIAYWQHEGATLYVALDGSELGAVNLVIATDEELWVLHSSAALGSLLFVPGDSAWQQSHGYTWCCRSANDDTARLELLENEGWQANIGYTGDVGVVEYHVEIPWEFAAVALIYHTEDRDPVYWPTDLEPEAVDQITNNRWSDPALDPHEWWMIVPG